MEGDPFWFFPDDIILQIAIKEPISGIPNLCKSSQRLNNLICNNGEFWKEKYIYDFGVPAINVLFWKDAYYNYGKIETFGEFSFNANLRVRDVSCKHYSTMFIDIDYNVLYVSLSEGETLIFDNIKAKVISCGNKYGMIIDFNDNLWAFGNNDYGQLGFGDNINRVNPKRILSFNKIKHVACGYNHTIVIDNDDNVWSFGDNGNGQLGINVVSNGTSTPEQIFLVPKVLPLKAKFASCGNNFTIVIDLNNKLRVFGNNNFLSLGLADYKSYYTPTKVSDTNFKYVSCGYNHSALIDFDDNLWIFGIDYYGPNGYIIGQPLRKYSKVKSVSCDYNNTSVIDLNDNVLIYSRNIQNSLIKAKSIACGRDFTIAIITTDPNLYLISYDESVVKLNKKEFLNFRPFPEYQKLIHNPNNTMLTFFGKDNDLYFSEVRYDKDTNEIFPPL
jgi:hypothetical protein